MISFVVIGRNESWRLEKCLSAVRRLAEKELTQSFEIIYVDSQSTDGSIDLAKQYADKIFLITGECNAAIGRNVGARNASGDILFFLDGDMELREGVLPTILNDDGSLKYPMMAGMVYDVLHDNDWQKRDEHPRNPFCEGTEWNEPSTGMFVVRRKVWDLVGGMDNRLARCEDYDFGFRVYEIGIKVRRIGHIWVNHYTRYYAVRRESLSVYKYSSMLTRKHSIKPCAFKLLLTWNYSAYLFVVCIFCFLFTLSLWPFLVYLLVLLYRTARVIQRTPTGLNQFDVLWQRFAKDVLLLYYMITYWPKQPVVSYQRAK